MSAVDRRIRVLRVVARLNIGGPAIHVALLSRPSASDRFESLLVTGTENAGEGTMIDMVRGFGIEPVVIPEMVGDSAVGLRDAIALWKLVRLIRRFRPDIIDTHTAKAGLLGRVAGALTRVPVRIHTFHGHVLHGYYSPAKNWLFRRVEHALARLTTRIIAVSEQVRQDLVRYGVASPDKIAVVHLGLHLSEFLLGERHRGELKTELGLPENTLLVGIVGRIFAIKNHALFVEAAALVAREVPEARFVIVGDGILREDTAARARQLGIADRAIFTGWRRDMPVVCADLSVLVVSSDNEGTPMSAIEAMASSVPVVVTRVGGLPDLVREGETGVLVPPGDAGALGTAITSLLKDSARRERMGASARQDVAIRFDVRRMVQETHALYEACLSEGGSGRESREGGSGT